MLLDSYVSVKHKRYARLHQHTSLRSAQQVQTLLRMFDGHVMQTQATASLAQPWLHTLASTCKLFCRSQARTTSCRC